MNTNAWLTLVMVVLLVACAPEKPAEETVKIGGLFGLTGFVSFAGEASRDGFILAIEDSGMNVDYVIEDFQSDFKNVVTASTKLIDVDDVQVIIGPEWTEFAEVIAPISTEKKIVFISPWMGGEGIASEYYFTMTPSERIQLNRLIDYMVRKNVRRIVLVYTSNSWSFGNVKIFKEELKERNIDVVGEFSVGQDALDYKTEIVKIKELAPDAIYAPIAADDSAGVFGQQLHDLGANYQLYVPHSRGSSPIFQEKFGDVTEGTIYPESKKYKNIEVFNKKYEARFGKKPAAISAGTAYDATTLVLNAIKNGAKTSENIRTYLMGVQGYEGYTNAITFNQQRQQASEEVVIKQIKGHSSIILEE